MEHAFDRGLAAGMGINLPGLDIYTPSNAEDVADALKEMVRSGFYSMVVVDSIGAMISQKEFEKDADEATVALKAKIVTRMVHINAVEAAKTGVVVLLINQVRAAVDATRATTTTSGGFALRHCTTHKLKMKRTGTMPYTVTVDGEKQMVGQEVSIEVERNRVAPPKRVAMVSLMNQDTQRFGPRGIDRAYEAAKVGIRTGVIVKSGGWYTAPGKEKVQGEDKVIDLMRADPELVEEIRHLALAALSGDLVAPEDSLPELDLSEAEMEARDAS
jgi:recombination protein RecA